MASSVPKTLLWTQPRRWNYSHRYDSALLEQFHSDGPQQKTVTVRVRGGGRTDSRAHNRTSRAGATFRCASFCAPSRSKTIARGSNGRGSKSSPNARRQGRLGLVGPGRSTVTHRRLICSWSSFKEFKYIAIYRDSHAVAKRH